MGQQQSFGGSHRRNKSNSIINDNASASHQNSERALLVSQQHTRRDYRDANIASAQISQRSNHFAAPTYTQQTHPALLSKRSSSRLSELGEAVSHKLEQMAEKRAEMRRSTLLTNSSNNPTDKVSTSSKRRNAYVMGQ